MVALAESVILQLDGPLDIMLREQVPLLVPVAGGDQLLQPKMFKIGNCSPPLIIFLSDWYFCFSDHGRCPSCKCDRNSCVRVVSNSFH